MKDVAIALAVGFAVLLLATAAVLTQGFGIWATTAIERKVFEESYQRSEAIKSRIATLKAELAAVERKLAVPNLDEHTRGYLESQKAAIQVQLDTAKGLQ